MRIASYTDLRNNIDHYVDAVINDCDTIEGRNGGANDLVLMSLEEYNSIMETLYIMSSPQLVEDIRQGEEDIKNGNVYRQNDDESIEDFLERVSCIN